MTWDKVVVDLIGLGLIGTRIAEICRLAFRCRILAADPYLDAETVAARGGEKVELATLLAESDIVSINCPLNDETRGMIGAAALARMRPGAILVNTARQFIHGPAPAGLAVQQDKRTADVRVAHSGEPAFSSRRQARAVAAQRFHEKKLGQLGEHRLAEQVKDKGDRRPLAAAHLHVREDIPHLVVADAVTSESTQVIDDHLVAHYHARLAGALGEDLRADDTALDAFLVTPGEADRLDPELQVLHAIVRRGP